jgi:hypothetical protein
VQAVEFFWPKPSAIEVAKVSEGAFATFDTAIPDPSGEKFCHFDVNSAIGLLP